MYDIVTQRYKLVHVCFLLSDSKRNIHILGINSETNSKFYVCDLHLKYIT